MLTQLKPNVSHSFKSSIVQIIQKKGPKAISYLSYSLEYSINSRNTTYQNVFFKTQKLKLKRMYSKKTNGEWTIGAKINRSGQRSTDQNRLVSDRTRTGKI